MYRESLTSIYKCVSLLCISITFLFCSVFLIHNLSEYDEFCQQNKSFIITLENGEVIHCDSINYNNYLFSSAPYITLTINGNITRNISKSDCFTLETVYQVDEPTFFQYLKGDYRDEFDSY